MTRSDRRQRDIHTSECSRVCGWWKKKEGEMVRKGGISEVKGQKKEGGKKGGWKNVVA